VSDPDDQITETNDRVTRFEVIDEVGRVLVRSGLIRVKLAYQDEGRTLKVFLTRDIKHAR
jgi:hypothetical protein